MNKSLEEKRLEIRKAIQGVLDVAMPMNGLKPHPEVLEITQQEFQRGVILRALHKAKGCQLHAARILKINRGTIAKKCKELGVYPAEIREMYRKNLDY